MTTDDLRAAAERLRRLYANERYEDVYGVLPTGGGLQDRDEKAVIEAYLAGRSEDDGDGTEPATREWFRASFETESYWYWDVICIPGGAENVAIDENGDLVICHRSDSDVLLEKPTRSRVRRLIAALKGE